MSLSFLPTMTAGWTLKAFMFHQRRIVVIDDWTLNLLVQVVVTSISPIITLTMMTQNGSIVDSHLWRDRKNASIRRVIERSNTKESGRYEGKAEPHEDRMPGS